MTGRFIQSAGDSVPAVVGLLASLLSCYPAYGQAPAFGGVEIRESAPNTMPQMRARLGNGRYELRNATAIDLIRTAWNVDADSISGGPDWLDLNRYDVTATVPATPTPDTLRSMLQGMLKDRFQLSVRNGEKQTPAYEITAGKKPLLKAAERTEASGCKFQAPAASVPRGAPLPPMTLVCTNVTLADFANILSRTPEASGYLFDYPLLDRSGLTGAWSFSFTWSPRRVYTWSPVATDPITLFGAFEKQLGLKVSLTKVAIPVLVVEKAKPPAVSDAPKPRMEFEVGEIRPDPDAPTDACSNVGIQPGGRVRILMTLRGLIWESFGAPFDFSRFIGGEKGLDSPCWQILAKAPVEGNVVGTPNPGGWNGAIWNGVDIDTMRMSLRSFLEDRFKLRAHLEDRIIDGYVLTASHPKLKKANPANRPSCKEGPGEDGKDPRLTNPIATRLITCRNMTLSQFAAQLNILFPGGLPITDATGISGRFDMTINFSPSGVAQTVQTEPGQAAEPTGAITLFDALKGQLGLKVETRKVMAPVVVVDRVNEKPTEN
jgi:uncharacterized protein (TIGR03435 family)